MSAFLHFWAYLMIIGVVAYVACILPIKYAVTWTMDAPRWVVATVLLGGLAVYFPLLVLGLLWLSQLPFMNTALGVFQ